jgi:hypothetical protein
MLHRQAHSQQLFSHAIQRVKQAKAPSDEVALEVRAHRTFSIALNGSPARP